MSLLCDCQTFGFTTLNWNFLSFNVGKYRHGLTCNHSLYLPIPRNWNSGTEIEHQTSHGITQCLLVPLITSSFISGLLCCNIVREFLTQCANQAYQIEGFHSNGNFLLQEILNHFIKTNITLHVRGKVQERWKLVVGALCSKGNDEEQRRKKMSGVNPYSF